MQNMKQTKKKVTLAKTKYQLRLGEKPRYLI